MNSRVCVPLSVTGRFLPLSWRRTRLLISLAAVAASMGLTGCGPQRMRVDYVNFERGYAETSNREVLLNLVRLEAHEPTYFFKLGQISSSYRMEASLSTTGNYSPVPAPQASGIPTGGGSPGLIYENDPSFTFIPVDDTTNAQLLLRAVPSEVFYNLYQQGARVDQLLRLLVDRIELTLCTPQHCYIETIRNVPPPIYHGTVDPVALNRYVTFLRVSAVVYMLQRRGSLLLSGEDKFKALNKHAALDTSQVTLTPKDILTAAAAGETWQLQKDGKADPNGDKWVLGKESPSTRFTLSLIPPPGSSTDSQVKFSDQASIDYIAKDLAKDSSYDQHALPTADLKNILEVLYNGFSIEEGSSTEESDEQGTCTAGHYCIFSHLVMRSLIGVMAAASQEQDPFEALQKNGTVLPADPMIASIQKILMQAAVAKAQEEAKANPSAAQGSNPAAAASAEPEPAPQNEPTFAEAVPVIERQPVLQLKWDPGISKTQPYTEVNFMRRNFEIADRNDLENTPESVYAEENGSWNRDAFRLICELASQVTVDISKFPLPEVLQLRTE